MAQYMIPVEDEERSIVASAIATDEGFDLIYRNFAPALRSFCQLRLGEAADADDACQETMLRAWAAFDRFRPTERMWPWLSSIAANVCRDMQRRRRLSAREDEVARAEVDGPDVEAERLMRAGIVNEAVRTLPDRYRSFVVHRDLEGWSYDEMAELEGTSVASVRSTLMRARKVLRHRIKEVASTQRNWPLPAAIPLAVARPFMRKAKAARARASSLARYLPFDVPSLAVANGLTMLAMTAVVISLPSPAATADIHGRSVPAVSISAAPSVDQPPAAAGAPAHVAVAPGRTQSTAPAATRTVHVPAVAPAATPLAPSAPGKIVIGPLHIYCTKGAIGEAVCNSVPSVP